MRNSLLIAFLCSFQLALAQLHPAPFGLPDYGFIHYDANQFELINDNPYYVDLYSKFDSLIKTGENRINIVHIGGSHIQADIYTHRIRQEMQSFYPGVLGSRGFFFPYKIAQTNSPSNLWIRFSGDWLTSKNTQPAPLNMLGLSGITTELVSDSGSLKVVASYDTAMHYDFNRIRVFCNAPLTGKIPALQPASLVKGVTIDPTGQYIQYNLTGYTDTLSLVFSNTDTLGPHFELYGISLENDDPGVVYNTIGVNGAMLKSYLKCGLFGKQLRILEPDWVILSIGTNEGNTKNFDAEAYRIEYINLLDSIRLVAPQAAILLTVPNDSYLQKRYVNYNTALIRDIIFDIARKRGCGVWDFYSIMGGLNSSETWYNNGLMARDHIHFNKPGYLLKGDLFFTAFLTSWPEVFDTLPIPEPTHPVSVSSYFDSAQHDLIDNLDPSSKHPVSVIAP
jgi:lysophospholipase L1-like esterase